MDVYGDDCGKMERSESAILKLGVPKAAQNGVSSYPGSGVPPEARNGVVFLGPGAPSAATNGVACPDPDAHVAILGSAVPSATQNAVSYADWLAAQLGSGAAAPAPRNTVPCPDGLVPQLGSVAAAPTPRNAVAYAYPEVLTAHLGSGGLATAGQNAAPSDPGMLMAHLSSGMSYSYPGAGAPAAAVNGGLSAVTMTSENAAGYAIDVYEGVAGFDFDHLNPTGTAAAAAGQDGGYDDSSGMALPFAAQVVTDRDVLVAAVAQDEVAGAAAERARGDVLGRLGLAAAALAVAGITAGGAATPATALGVFAMLIAGVTLVNVRVFRA